MIFQKMLEIAAKQQSDWSLLLSPWRLHQLLSSLVTSLHTKDLEMVSFLIF